MIKSIKLLITHEADLDINMDRIHDIIAKGLNNYVIPSNDQFVNVETKSILGELKGIHIKKVKND